MGHPGDEVGGRVGARLDGIAVQTVALAAADLTYRKANLEHAAASAANMMQTASLILLVAIPLTGIAGPDYTLGHVHPTTFLLVGAAGAAFWRGLPPGVAVHGPGVGDREVFLIALTLLLNIILLEGLLHRQEMGPARIRIEGVASW